MRLENIASGTVEMAYPFDFGEVISFESTIREIVQDLLEGLDLPLISAKFHNTVINVIFALTSQIRKETAINKVVLSGGSFQNKYILSRLELILKKEGFEVYSHYKIPSNDGGIALGQMVIAAKRRELGGID